MREKIEEANRETERDISTRGATALSWHLEDGVFVKWHVELEGGDALRHSLVTLHGNKWHEHLLVLLAIFVGLLAAHVILHHVIREGRKVVPRAQ